jgi:hypothetical protein
VVRESAQITTAHRVVLKAIAARVWLYALKAKTPDQSRRRDDDGGHDNDDPSRPTRRRAQFR